MTEEIKIQQTGEEATGAVPAGQPAPERSRSVRLPPSPTRRFSMKLPMHCSTAIRAICPIPIRRCALWRKSKPRP